MATELDDRAVTTLRMLSADMVQAADSGHPGLPLGCAPMAWTLWSRHLRHNPADPHWTDRDRFVLSAGHGSALLYALLHVFGYDLTLDDLRAFRQIGSRTPGHPERGHTPGVETTTGPLGQGLANAVGMAVAERMLAARFGGLVDHHTFVLCGDGCLMEGISHEAASLAGHLGLGRLVVLYDDNQITIDGSADRSCRDDAAARFAAYGWQTLRVDDGNDIDAIDQAIAAAKDDPRPSLISVRTVIGYGAPGIEGTAKAHGSPLGDEVLARTRERFGWPAEKFHVPADVRSHAASLAAAGAAAQQDWATRAAEALTDDHELALAWRRSSADGLTVDLEAALAQVPVGQHQATRQASARVLATVGDAVPELVGGSADLAGSTGTDTLPGGTVTRDDFSGRTIAFGIREHAMAAALNGIAAHGGLRPFGSTFLVFSDYLRPALRLSALMRLPVTYLLTHDSVVVGEDGPTHQPVEHLESLRLIPGLAVLRPADDVETVWAWRTAFARADGPTALILSRQALPPLGPADIDSISRHGARVVGPDVPHPEATVLATGSEVALAVDAAKLLTAEGLPTRVLSVPWRERFASLDPARRSALVGDSAQVVLAVEAGSTGGWCSLTGSTTHVLGVDRFGESGPGEAVRDRLGITVDALVDLVRQTWARVQSGTPIGAGSGR